MLRRLNVGDWETRGQGRRGDKGDKVDGEIRGTREMRRARGQGRLVDGKKKDA